MIIVVDRSIPYWKEAFSCLGEICPFSGRQALKENVRHADALVVRSVTPVNASLLEGSSVRFVASASAGTDHVDQEYLRSRGIYFTYAAGCNADSVSEYTMTVLHVLAARKNWELKDKSLGVVGVGNVGSRVEKKARALGMKVLLCDPPLQECTGDQRYQDLADILEADILSFHVPLTSNGPYPTFHMVNRDILGRLSQRQLLVNTARGAVFDNQELKVALQESRIAGAVLDVWEGEPVIDYSLLDLVEIGTPHLAGVTLDGRVRATEMVRQELCKFFGLDASWTAQNIFPEPTRIRPAKRSAGKDFIGSLLLQAYDILRDDSILRALKSLPTEEAAASFERLRSDYPLRSAFRHFIVELAEEHVELTEALEALGFQVSLSDQHAG